MQFFKPYITPTGRPHQRYTIGWWFHRFIDPVPALRRAWYYINDVWPAWHYAGPPFLRPSLRRIYKVTDE